MDVLQLKHLPAATQQKIKHYSSILKRSTDSTNIGSFWDVVVLTSGDEEQKKSYEQQIALKKSRNEIPGFVRYVVISDPVGAKIGNGGATMHVLEQLEMELDPEYLLQAKIMVIHAGGYSQRLPNVSVSGKAFMALPCGDPMLHMLDALLIMYIDLPDRMNPGVFLTASDVIFLFSEKGVWDMKRPGFTAIAHPASLETAVTHGVFVLEKMEEIAKKYAHDSSQPSVMGKAKRFLHKASVKTLEESGAKIPGTEQVYVDLGYYFDWEIARKLMKFYAECKPLKCEVDAYGDFLQALGPEATSDFCSNTANVTFLAKDLVETRKKVFELFQGTPLNVVVFNQAQFNHVGTTAEYMHHLFSNDTLRKSFGFRAETMVKETGFDTATVDQRAAKRMKISLEDCLVMHSILRDRTSVLVGEESVVEYCILEPHVSIGKKCIVSNLHIPSGLSVPDYSFLHTVPLTEGGGIHYATFAFDISDSMKASVSHENAKKLQYCGRDMAEAVKVLFQGVGFEQVLPATSQRYTLWNCSLFPMFSTRQESAKHAIGMLHRLKEVEAPQLAGDTSLDGRLVCVADMLKLKSIPTLLEYHNLLREQILN